MSKQNKMKGFTIAEALTTLALLGVIMALIIPTMVNNSYNASFVPAVRKTYGLLERATTQIMMNNAGTLANAFTNSANARDLIGNTLEYIRTCDATAVEGNCWTSSTEKLSNGASVESFDPDTNYVGAVLSDSTNLLIYISDTACSSTGVSIALPYAESPASNNMYCGKIIVDVNGINNPNTIGRDIFVFYLGKNGLYPGGDPHTDLNDTDTNCDPTDTGYDGWGCAAVLLNEGEMNY